MGSSRLLPLTRHWGDTNRCAIGRASARASRVGLSHSPGLGQHRGEGGSAYWAFAQAAMSGLLAGVRARQVAERSVGKVAGMRVGPQ